MKKFSVTFSTSSDPFVEQDVQTVTQEIVADSPDDACNVVYQMRRSLFLFPKPGTRFIKSIICYEEIQ